MNQLGTKVNATENQVTDRESSSFQGEPEFLVSDRANLQVSPENVSSATAQYFDYQVLRSPHVLNNHVRRIYLYSALSDAENLYGALVDLLIVLNGRGASLRERMLQSARPILNKACYDRLIECDNTAESKVSELPSSKACLLARGTIGTDQLVVLSDDK